MTPTPCPSGAELWAGVRGELSPERMSAIAEHRASCDDCAAAWSVAVDFAEFEIRPQSFAAAAPATSPMGMWVPVVIGLVIIGIIAGVLTAYH